MVQVENPFALLEGDEDTTKLIEAAKVAVKAAAEEETQPQKPVEKKEETVWTSRMMRAKRPSQIVFRKEKPEEKQVEETSVGNSAWSHRQYNNNTGHSNTNQDTVAAGNTHNYNNGYRGGNRFKGNYNNADGYQGISNGFNDSQELINKRRYHGGANDSHEYNNNRRYYEGVDGYHGGSRGAYRNRNNEGNSICKEVIKA
ncbi:conserved hypothetical protein [Ricinus communis]|uniref:Uncharacterized protein n=1 Tax=Ricinus communis TaxID=3988 RepID=B9T8F1_RICCO|nr:conserved hypothetical protein [Ricinus communis]